MGSLLQDQPERAMRMFVKMKQMDVLPDVKTYELLFSLFGNVNAPYEEGNRLSQVDAAKRIRMIEMDMEKHGIQHSHASMMNLVSQQLSSLSPHHKKRGGKKKTLQDPIYFPRKISSRI